MLRKLVTRSLVFFLVVVGVSGRAQVGSSWVVRPEWVKADEDFLASDVLAGRGSATRDEQLAATYVASEFESYGLQFAPGMGGYLQSAAIETPTLDGHAALAIGKLTLTETTDFDLLMSSGKDATGPLVRMPAANARGVHVQHGAAVLLTGATDARSVMDAIAFMRRAGAGLLLVPGGGETENLFTLFGGKTSVPMRLVDDPTPRASLTVVILHGNRASQISELPASALPEGASVSFQVHQLAEAAPRLTFNAIGYIPGSDPSAGTLLLTAHLDHVGVGRPVNGDPIYNGANDDAAGTTAVLELAHALAAGPKLRRGVLFVCYGSEELGEFGSTYFAEHPPIPLDHFVANLEFEMIGNQDPKMPKGVLLLTGWDRSNLGPTLKEHGALLGPDPYPEQHFFERSDNYSLALRGVVAHTAAGWGTVPTYHQPTDDLQHLDLAFMTAAIQSLVEPVRWLASGNFVPRWNPGGQPKEK